jgi:hypothetical protein
LLLTMVPQQRGRVLYENESDYDMNGEEKVSGD